MRVKRQKERVEVARKSEREGARDRERERERERDPPCRSFMGITVR